MKIAMWSGPRNLSTAMMYSFAQRADFRVWDEPFYAAYLRKTGLDHPMREAVIAAGEPEAAKVIAKCTAPSPTHSYQKHMTQHMLPEIPRDWLADVVNVFLIRHPARVVASYAAKREHPTPDDIGFRQQAELYDLACAMGQSPIVIDSADIRVAPEQMLRKLCAGLGLAFDPAMLSWPRGGNPADGAWAPHWYGAVHASTGFSGAEGDVPKLSGAYGDLAQDTMPFYERLKKISEKFANA